MSKQAYYKRIKTRQKREQKAEVIKMIINPIRGKMPRYGAEKLHLDIKDDLKKNDIKIGRNNF